MDAYSIDYQESMKAFGIMTQEHSPENVRILFFTSTMIKLR